MSKTKLTVRTDIGTFTRTTARSYSHVIVIKGRRSDWLERNRLRELENMREQATRYRRALETGEYQLGPHDRSVATPWALECHARYLADGSYQKWADDCAAAAAKLEAEGPITEDSGDWGVWGWAGRLDLAVKEAATSRLEHYRHVRIYDVATGALVREVR